MKPKLLLALELGGRVLAFIIGLDMQTLTEMERFNPDNNA